jgi:hypothetical protein
LYAVQPFLINAYICIIKRTTDTSTSDSIYYCLFRSMWDWCFHKCLHCFLSMFHCIFFPLAFEFLVESVLENVTLWKKKKKNMQKQCVSSNTELSKIWL